jgi:hypothetical protein
MRCFVNSAKLIPLTRETMIADRLKPELLYDHRVPGVKLSDCWRERMSSTCACVYSREVRGQPAMPATLPQSRSPLV